MDKLLQRVSSLKDELAELRDEFDSIDSTHYQRFTRLRDQINAKQKELESYYFLETVKTLNKTLEEC